MALLIDTPRWPWRGRLWAHLISDDSLDELHAAGRALGLRWLSFGRDHYDVPDTIWPDACEVAELVDSREIVRSLRATGLRFGGGKPLKTWRWHPTLPNHLATGRVTDWLAEAGRRVPDAEVEILGRPGEYVVLHLLDRPSGPDMVDLITPPGPGARVIETVADDRWSVELVLPDPGRLLRGSGPSDPVAPTGSSNPST